MRILVVEDDPDVGDALTKRLRREGHAVDWESDGEAADDILSYQSYDVIILDIGLPNMDGFEILRCLRKRGSLTPVLMLTARSQVEDRVDALDVGADDYLSKPFDFREFDARCRALLRRSQGMASNVITVGDVIFDRNAKSLHIGNMQIALPNREFRLLEILLGNFGRVMSKEQIASQDARQSSEFGALVEAFREEDIQLFDTTAEILNEVENGNLALGYNVLGSYAAARAEKNANLRIIYPEDYTLAVARTAVIPKMAPNAMAAHMFLDFLISVDGQKHLTVQGKLSAVRPEVTGPYSRLGITERSMGPLRPIALGPGLLVYLDQQKRQRLLNLWFGEV